MCSHDAPLFPARAELAARLRPFLLEDVFEQGRQPESLGSGELAGHRGQGSGDLGFS
jgi:hypothetical protein